MIFGYTPLDPVFVLAGSLFSLYLLLVHPNRLMLYLPAALSVYAIAPFVTLLTVADTVPLLILLITLLSGKFALPQRIQPWLITLVFLIFFQALVALVADDLSPDRILIRSLYYLTLLTLFIFSLNACRKDETYHLLLRGMAIIAAIHAIYGLYQLIAVPAGLPVRGILRGTTGADIAMEGIFVRINGLANEPKRLGYVLGIGALAFFELARRHQGARRRRLRQAGALVLAISLLTFSGSYFLALALMGLVLVVLYPRFLKKLIVPGIVVGLAIPIFPDTSKQLWESIDMGFDRRATEVVAGLYGQKIYRQEFFAEEYLSIHPETILTGVGIGRSNSVLHEEFGNGAGYDEGYLLPLNSEALQILFDLGGLGAIIVYGTLLALIWRAWRLRETFLMMALLLLGMQSLSILTMQFLAILMGAAWARMPAKDKHPTPKRPTGFRMRNLSRNNLMPKLNFLNRRENI